MTQTVTTTSDSGAGSLRQAILDANTAGGDLIEFAIAGTGPHTITLASVLPTITTATTINGYSQSGATENTRTTARGSDAVLRIQINAAGVGSGNPGLAINHVNALVRGITIYSGANIGYRVETGRVSGCWAGLQADGTAGGCGSYGFSISPFAGTLDAFVGGVNPGDRCLIAHCSDGVFLGRFAEIRNAQIGINPAGAFARNGNTGLFSNNAPGALAIDCLIADHNINGINLIGSSAGLRLERVISDSNSKNNWNRAVDVAASGGVQVIDCEIYGFNQNGVRISGSTTGVEFRRTLIHSPVNAGPATYLIFQNGNENNSIPTPAITAAATNATESEVSGTVTGAIAATEYRVEVFSGGNGMQLYLGSALFTTDGSGNASWTAAGLAGDTVGRTARATITNPATGDTSRVSGTFTFTELESGTSEIIAAGLASTMALGSGAIAALIEPNGLPSSLAVGNAAIELLTVNIQPLGRTSTLAIGNAIIEPVTLPIAAEGLASSLQFGAATIAPETQVINAVGHASTLAIGNATVTTLSVVQAAGLPSQLAVGNATVQAVTVEIQCSGLASSAAMGSYQVMALVEPIGAPSTLSIGDAAIAAEVQQISAVGLPSSLATGSAAITSVTTITASGLAPTLVLGDSTVVSLPAIIATTGLASGAQYGEATISVFLAASGAPSDLAIGDASIVSIVEPSGLASGLAIGAGEVVALVEAIGAASELQAGNVTIQMGGQIISAVGLPSTLVIGDVTIETLPIAISTTSAPSELSIGSLGIVALIEPVGAPSTLAIGDLEAQRDVFVVAAAGLPSTLTTGSLSVATEVQQIACVGLPSQASVGDLSVVSPIQSAGLPSELAIGSLAVSTSGQVIQAAGLPSSLATGILAVELVYPLEPIITLAARDGVNGSIATDQVKPRIDLKADRLRPLITMAAR